MYQLSTFLTLFHLQTFLKLLLEHLLQLQYDIFYKLYAVLDCYQVP